MKILDIGCNGKKYKSESDTVIGLDVWKFPDVDVIHDLEKMPLPFADESFDMVYSSHTFEHIHNRVQLVRDIWRILKPNGLFKCIAPHHTNPISARIDHIVTGFSLDGFNSFTTKLKKEKFIEVPFAMESVAIKLISPFGFLNGLANRFPDFYEWRLSWLIPAVEVCFELRKV